MTRNMMKQPEKRYCNHCKEDVDCMVEILSTGTHYAKALCAKCGRYICFLKKPDNESKRAKNKYSAADLGIEHCQMCLRKRPWLGTRGTLEVHHVDEISDGGIDAPDNIWVLCTSCHRLIHHQRTYLNNHLKTMYTLMEFRADLAKDNVPKDSQRVLERVFNAHQELNNARQRS